MSAGRGTIGDLLGHPRFSGPIDLSADDEKDGAFKNVM